MRPAFLLFLCCLILAVKTDNWPSEKAKKIVEAQIQEIFHAAMTPTFHETLNDLVIDHRNRKFTNDNQEQVERVLMTFRGTKMAVKHALDNGDNIVAHVNVTFSYFNGEIDEIRMTRSTKAITGWKIDSIKWLPDDTRSRRGCDIHCIWDYVFQDFDHKLI